MNIEIRESTQFASGEAYSVHVKNQYGNFQHIGYLRAKPTANGGKEFEGFDHHYEYVFEMPGSPNLNRAAMQLATAISERNK